MEKYTGFDCPDFVADDYFTQWVLHPDADSETFWGNFLLKHAHKKGAMDEAAKMIKQLRPTSKFSDGETNDLWNRIAEETNTHNMKRITLPYRYIAAACVVLLLLSTLFFIRKYNANNMMNVETGFAQKRSVRLPDGSLVMLNANSHLRYPGKFADNKVREVWITGEAYFDIKHLNKNPQQIKTGERFIVHANNMNIEVLGTRFDVYRRHTDTKVALIQGKVQVSFADREDKILMKPGELVAYAGAEKKVNKSANNTDSPLAWVSDKIVLNNTSLNDIKTILEDNYGIMVNIEDTNITDAKLSGELPANNLGILTKALSQVLGKSITRNGNTITIHK